MPQADFEGPLHTQLDHTHLVLVVVAIRVLDWKTICLIISNVSPIVLLTCYAFSGFRISMRYVCAIEGAYIRLVVALSLSFLLLPLLNVLSASCRLLLHPILLLFHPSVCSPGQRDSTGINLNGVRLRMYVL